MSLRKVTARDGGPCAPKSGFVWCLSDRHADGRKVHQHFTHEAKGKNVEIALKAERIGGAVATRPTRQTFEPYAREWWAAQTWKDPDAARYALARAYPYIGAKPLPKVTELALQGMQRQLLERLAYSTVGQTMHFTKRVLQQAHRAGLISTDPTIGVRLPRRDSLDTDGVVTADQVPTRDEALAIVEGAPGKYRLAVVLGIGCGMRVGEVLGLTPNRVDLKAGTVTIDRQWQRRGLVSPKTWRGVRTIEVPDVVLAELGPLVHRWAAPDMPILAGVRGGTMRRDDVYDRAWKPALVAAGIDPDRYVFHSARHYAVSSMLAEGVTAVEVAAYVGDSVETITTVYSHFLRGSASMAKRALDRALADAPRHKFATSSAEPTT